MVEVLFKNVSVCERKRVFFKIFEKSNGLKVTTFVNILYSDSIVIY